MIIYRNRVWYELNVVQRGAKFIPVYMIYAAQDKSDCGCEAGTKLVFESLLPALDKDILGILFTFKIVLCCFTPGM